MTKDTPCFPEYFPKGCPPSEAEEKEICVFRYCKGVEVTSDDFLSYYQLDSVRYCNNINAYGLSVLNSKDESLKGLKLPAIKKRFKSIASGITYKYTGVIKPTPNNNNPSHCTWWLYKNTEPHTYFVICG